MMTQDQVKIVTRVYNKFFESETSSSWTEIDHYLSLLEFIDDDQLFRESDVLYSAHNRGIPTCDLNHPREECFIPIIMDAVKAILDLYKETNYLHKNNRYILQYYLALSQAQMILVDLVDSQG